jgi:hypothetical protein
VPTYLYSAKTVQALGSVDALDVFESAHEIQQRKIEVKSRASKLKNVNFFGLALASL